MMDTGTQNIFIYNYLLLSMSRCYCCYSALKDDAVFWGGWQLLATQVATRVFSDFCVTLMHVNNYCPLIM